MCPLCTGLDDLGDAKGHPTSFLRTPIMMLLDRQAGVGPNSQVSSRFLVKSDKAVPNSYLCCELWAKLLLVSSAAWEVSRLSVCGVEFLIPAFCPLDAPPGAIFQFPEDWTHIAPCRHPSNIVHEEAAFNSGDSVRHLFYEH